MSELPDGACVKSFNKLNQYEVSVFWVVVPFNINDRISDQDVFWISFVTKLSDLICIGFLTSVIDIWFCIQKYINHSQIPEDTTLHADYI